MGGKPSDLDEYKDFAERRRSMADIDGLPRDEKYDVYVGGPGLETSHIVTISGKYHALYIRDRLTEECGFMGISFGIEET